MPPRTINLTSKFGDSLFIGGYMIRRLDGDGLKHKYELVIQKTMTGEEIDVKESELTELLDKFWSKHT